jgi:TonB family protein
MTLVWIAKATVILGAALAAVTMMRRQPAGMRFFTLAAAFAALLALPMIEAVIPRPSAPVARAAASFTVTAASVPVSVEERSDWPQLIWLVGVVLFLVRSAAGYAMSRSAVPVVPMTVGVFRPKVMLPPGAEAWSDELRRSVMLHEEAHISRRDPFWNLLALLARAIYWFHPLAWWALYRLQTEREHACDDAVVTAGVRPSEYATHLMLCARSSASPAAGLPMAGQSSLTTRVEAVLSPATFRAPVSFAQRALLTAGCCTLLFPLATFGSPSFSPRSLPMYRKLVVPLLAAASAAQSAELSGRVYDASNATVPQAQVVLRSRDTSTEFKTVSGPAGEYRLAGLPGGSYDLEVLMPGFARYQRRGIKLTDSTVTSMSTVLNLGEVQETLQVTAPGQARPQQPAPQRILVGGHVRPVRILKQVKSIYPETARTEGREGNVVLRAVIGVDGTIVNVSVLPGADADLAAAAEEAVRQWVYEPTLLNGKPVETVTTVEINFRLGAV